MSDKSRQEFVEKFVERWGAKLDDLDWSDTKTPFHDGMDIVVKMLTEYDKLKSEKWARLKEFVRNRYLEKSEWSEFEYAGTAENEILAEMERLEKEEA